MEDVRHQNELIDKETVELRLERERFGKDWEALDKKGAGVNKELELLGEKKQNFEKLQISEEERLKKEKARIKERFQLELESIRVEKESCRTAMEHEKKMLAEHAENEQNLMLQDFEQQRQNLENDMLQRQKEWEEIVQEKERAFEEIRLKESRNISDLKKDSDKRKDELEAERCCMEKERQEMELNKKQLEENTIEMFKDIQALDNLSQKLKNQREQLMSERACFSALIDKVKSCENCRYSMQTFLHHDLQLPPFQKCSLPRHSINEVKDASNAKEKATAGVNMGFSNLGGPISVFRNVETQMEHICYLKKANVRARTTVNDERGPLVGLVNDSSRNFQTGAGVGKEKVDNASSVDDSIVEGELQDIESQKSDLKGVHDQSGRKHGPGLHATSGHKRCHSQLSRLSESEQNVDHRNGKTDSVTTGGRSKRQQTAPGQSRYNFRRCTIRSNLVQVSTVKSTKFSSDKIVRFDKTANHAVESIIDEVKSAENITEYTGFSHLAIVV
ncbi:LOW QUALITY PROTEIN: hypothetical protein Cgig2_010745 [Carnegiea gigantea]|uniref:Uncharacterized protein n=1 Tax=Carnegiea gigantea TaxID=171969 RepID=A0A9Q1KLD4_9CARY|nr:LOW QUALITY PROTEIN: hypothetical protein Cgig2_010745 [Carnegiea gigantea]